MLGPGEDAGPRTPAEPDFGTPCTDPHVAMTVQDRSSTGVGQIRRFQLPSLEPCRESALARAHASFGSEVYSITGLPDGTEAVGVNDAVLRLDAEGFPLWRQQLDRGGAFHPLELFVVAVGGADRIAAAYWGSSTTATGMLLLDLDGAVVHEWTEGFSGANSFAADPATPGSVLVSRYGDIQTTPLDTATTRLADGPELLPRSATHGSLITIDTDPTTGRAVIAYQMGVADFTPGGTLRGPVTCATPCNGFHAATWDPTDSDAVLALCIDADAGRTRHLVRAPLDGSACELAFDGTFLDNGLPTEIAIVP